MGRWVHGVAPAISVLLLLLILTFPSIRDLALGLGQGARIAVATLVLAPLAVPLGMPFPIGVALLTTRGPNLMAWAWAVNAVMTVVGSLGAVVLSMTLGFTDTLLIAGALYLLAGLFLLRLERLPTAVVAPESPAPAGPRRRARAPAAAGR